MRAFFSRRTPPMSPRQVLSAGAGAALAVALVAGLTVFSGAPLLMAPFGASCVLLFAAPASPLSQPANVLFGHLSTAACGLALRQVLPNEWWALALAVGVAVAVMAALRVTHPPAGANPLVVFSLDPTLRFLIEPVALGSLALLAAATAYHRLSGGRYPHQAP